MRALATIEQHHSTRRPRARRSCYARLAARGRRIRHSIQHGLAANDPNGNPIEQSLKQGEGNMAHRLNRWLVVGIFWLGVGAAHAEPCFMRDVNGTPVAECTKSLPFAFPTGGPGELKVGTPPVVGKGFGAQAAGATAQPSALPAASGNAWSGQPGEFGVHGPERVRQGKQLPVAAPAEPAGN